MLPVKFVPFNIKKSSVKKILAGSPIRPCNQAPKIQMFIYFYKHRHMTPFFICNDISKSKFHIIFSWIWLGKNLKNYFSRYFSQYALTPFENKNCRCLTLFIRFIVLIWHVATLLFCKEFIYFFTFEIVLFVLQRIL